MKRISIIFLLIFSFVNGSSIGKTGLYYIKGIAYGDKLIMKNVQLVIRIGKDTKIISTNDKGEYKIEVFWTAPNPTKLVHRIHQKDDNPEYIYVSCEGKEIKIKNQWKKYARKSKYKSPWATKKQDLYLSK